MYKYSGDFLKRFDDALFDPDRFVSRFKNNCLKLILIKIIIILYQAELIIRQVIYFDRCYVARLLVIKIEEFIRNKFESVPRIKLYIK